MKADIGSFTFDELSAFIRKLSLPAFRAKQIYKWLQQKGAASFDEMTDLPIKLREILKEEAVIRSCSVKNKQVSAKDGTVKLLFELIDGELIEGVLMKYKYGYSLCVSTQVGCRMNCAFCATGVSGFVRDLSPFEILSQIHCVRREQDVRVSHIVLMGMGEPLDNYENVLRFLSLVNDPEGLNIGMRNISLSTCGLVPEINKLAEQKLQLTLSVSLHAPNNEIRSRLMPVNRAYDIDALLNACRNYVSITSRRISFEYAMFDGINDTKECALELSERLKGMPAHINLIPANDVIETGLHSSSAESIENFAAILTQRGRNVTVRRSLGGDIDASCGQLRRRHIDK